jgi:hypothetical protein
MVAVAALAGGAAGPFATITVTWRLTKSAAIGGSRSFCPSAQRYSIAKFRPSTKPASLRPWRNPPKRSAYCPGDVLLRNPTTGIAGCCACAESGHVVAAAPSSVMKSRRCMCSPSEDHPTTSL